MKRIICAFLVAVLCMNLYVPALAVEEVPDYEVGTFGGFAICNRPLVGNHKRIVVDIVCVDYLDMVATQ